MTVKEKFWSKVNKTDDCWEWMGARIKQGYGRFYNNKEIRAHRFSWELHFGKIPKGMLVLHHCDNPPCVRPNHLWVGTFRDNTQDMVRKNRGRVNNQDGEKNSMSKLTLKQVLEIRKLYRGGDISQQLIANQFGVSRRCIGFIIKGQTWKYN